MLCLSALAAALAAPPTFTHVSVSATAPWANDPLVEAASLIHDTLGGAATVQFLMHAASRWPCDASMRCALRTLELLKLPPFQHRALSAALAARIDAPKVEAWAQLAVMAPAASSSNAAWLVTCGTQLHASVDAAVAALSSTPCDASGTTLVPAALDHEISTALATAAAAADDRPTLIAYVDPRAAAGLGDALTALLTVPAATRVVLRYRPMGASAEGGGGGVPLQGFGAIVRVKASEYKVVDDRGGEEAGEESDDDDSATDAVEGGGDAAPSWLLRRRASEPRVGEAALPAEKHGALPVQAAVAVLRAKRPLGTLRDVSGSLPSLSRSLSKTSLISPANAPLAAALEAQWALVESARGSLLLNGAPLSVGSAGFVHDGMRAVLAEATAASELIALGLTPDAAGRLLLEPPPPLRVDARGLDALWLSDVSSADGPFKSWPTELSVAAKPGYRGSVQFSRHNLFTALFVFDVATVRGAAVGAHVATLLKRSAPLRIGVVPRAADGGPSSLGTRIVAHAYALGGKAALVALLRSLGSSAAKLEGAVEGVAGGGMLPRTALVEGLLVALEAAAVAKAGGGGKKKKKVKKAKEAKTDAEGASEAESKCPGDACWPRAEALLAALESTAPAAEGEGVDGLALERADAMGAAAAALGLPAAAPLVMLNGLVLTAAEAGASEAGASEAAGAAADEAAKAAREAAREAARLGEAVAEALRREVKAVRALVDDGRLADEELGSVEAPPGLLHAALLAASAKSGTLAATYSREAEQAAREEVVLRVVRDASAGAAEARAAATTSIDRRVAARALNVLERRVWTAGSGRRLRLSPRLAGCAAAGGCIELAGRADGAALHLVAIAEPLTAEAHRMATFLIALRASLQVSAALVTRPPPPQSNALIPPLIAPRRAPACRCA